MTEDRSLRGRGRRAVARANEAVSSTAGTLSGKSVEQQVSEYSELYTQVLLGVHADLQAQARQIEALQTEHELMKGQGGIYADLESQARQIEALQMENQGLKQQIAGVRTVRLVAIAALVVALAAVGGLLWLAL